MNRSKIPARVAVALVLSLVVAAVAVAAVPSTPIGEWPPILRGPATVVVNSVTYRIDPGPGGKVSPDRDPNGTVVAAVWERGSKSRIWIDGGPCRDIHDVAPDATCAVVR